MPDFRALCAACGWTAREAARRAGYSPNMGPQWLRGSRTCPPSVAAWLSRVAAALDQLPPPPRLPPPRA
jgi:hypothetical protein